MIYELPLFDGPPAFIIYQYIHWCDFFVVLCVYGEHFGALHYAIRCFCSNFCQILPWSSYWNRVIYLADADKLHNSLPWYQSTHLLHKSHRVSRSLQWRHNKRDSVSNHRRLACLLNRSFRCRSKKISWLRIIGLCEGNSSVTAEFPAQRASNAENVSVWWCHHLYWCGYVTYHGIHFSLRKKLNLHLPIVTFFISCAHSDIKT